MSDSIIVRVTRDSYDMASTGQQTQVYVQIPEVARDSWLLPEDTFHALKDRAWPEVLDVVHGYITYGGAASNASSTAAWRAIREWMRDDANRDEMQVAFEEDCTRRDPVARKLLKEIERLRARVAELEDKKELADRERVELQTGLERALAPFCADPTAAAVAAAEVRHYDAAWFQRDAQRLLNRVAELEAERHSTNESLSEAAEQLRADRDRIAELEKRPALGDVVAWLSKKAREYRNTGSKQHALQADAVEALASKVARGAIRPNNMAGAPPLTVYRASHDSIVMGLYTTADAARAHCEAEERRAWAKGSAPTNFGWIEDEEDGVAELTAWVGGEECTTGYVVTALEIATSYDEEADE